MSIILEKISIKSYLMLIPSMNLKKNWIYLYRIILNFKIYFFPLSLSYFQKMNLPDVIPLKKIKNNERTKTVEL